MSFNLTEMLQNLFDESNTGAEIIDVPEECRATQESLYSLEREIASKVATNEELCARSLLMSSSVIK